MRNPARGTGGSVLARTAFVFTCLLTVLSFTTPDVHAQCRPLTSEVCVDTVGNGRHFSFNQTVPYWTIVAVTPDPADDKDITLYPNCASGTPLASSTFTSGTDFIIGDFNHNTLGTYYVTTHYGTETDPYDIDWVNGGHILAISNYNYATTGDDGPTCDLVRVWDAYLEAGFEYRVTLWNGTHFPKLFLSLFRNPGTSEFWGGRIDSEWEIDGFAAPFIYTPPATDWYGVTVVPDKVETILNPAGVIFERLDDCIALDSDVCKTGSRYSVNFGPFTDFSVTPTASSWMAIAVAPQSHDFKTLMLRTECDENGSLLAQSYAGYGSSGMTELVVGDFNHADPYTVHPRIDNGGIVDNYTIEWTQSLGYFPIGAPGADGEFNTLGEGGHILDVYDIELFAGTQYRVSFAETGTADIHVALFQNPAGSEFWTDRYQELWELSDPTASHVFTAPATDVYGLVVFGNGMGDYITGGTGTYHLDIERYDDCYLEPSGACSWIDNHPYDFSFDANGYWAVVGVTPGDGDDKDISVFTECDGEGTLLAASGYIEGADFVVGDFNHIGAGTYHARVTYGDSNEPFTTDSDRGNSPSEDMFPHDTVVEGFLGDFGTECKYIKMWDVYLEAGETYQVGLTRGGTNDIWVALFHNPGSGDYWVGRGSAVWETPAQTTFDYTPPVTDWYGIVAFANKREKWGNYTIRISPTSVGTGVDPEPIVPDQFALYQNTPNPFNPSTVIRYDVPAGGASVSLRIFDVNGRLVKTLVSENLSPGEKSATWHGDDNSGNRVASGVYFYSFETSGFRETRKLVLMK